jgi:catecholate siderophore receptor
LLAASLASTAFAGEGVGEKYSEGGDSILPEVVVTGQKGYNPGTTGLHKNTQPILETPQSITVLPQQLLQDQAVTTMKDALRNVSGVSIAAGEGSSQGDNFTIRGFSARSDIFLDGMRDFGSYYRDPFNDAQIDVLQGPSGITFGRGSTGGAVNQASKLPLAGPLDEATFMVGSDDTRRVTADISRPVQELGAGAGLRLNVMGDEGGVAGRNVAKNSRYGFAPTLTLGTGGRNRLTLSYFHQSESDIPDYGVPWIAGAPASVDRRDFYGFSSDYLKAVADVLTMKGEHDVNDRLTLRDQVRYAVYTRNVRITEPQVLASAPGTPLSAMTVNRNELTSDSTEGSLQNQADVLAKFDTGPIRHELVAGVENDHETSDPTRTSWTGVPTTTLVGPNDGSPFAGAGALSSAVQATVDTFGFYALDTLKLGDKWDLTGGGRWDHVQSYYSSYAPASNPQYTSFSRLDQLASWRGALVFKPKPNGSVYFAAGTSFDPSAEQLSLSAATAGLPPEKNTSYEVGSKWDLFDGRLSASGAVFRQDQTNTRETDPNNALLQILSGDQRVDGFSVGLRGDITELWQAFVGYTFLRGRVMTSVIPNEVGNPLANTPKNTVNAWTTYKLPWDVQLGAGMDAVSARAGGTTPTTTAGLAEQGYIGQAPGYVIGNAMVKKQLTKKISLQLTVNNLADAYYLDGVHPGHVIPGAGRTFLMTMDWKF